MDTGEEIHRDMNTSSDDSHTDDSINHKSDSPTTDDGTECVKTAKAIDNGNIIFDFEGNFVFPSFERDNLDWDSLSKSIGYTTSTTSTTTEHNAEGIYYFPSVAIVKRLIRVVLFR